MRRNRHGRGDRRRSRRCVPRAAPRGAEGRDRPPERSRGEGGGGHVIDPPLAVLAELTHRCPLQCPYCSNPVELERSKTELSTAEWIRVMREIADVGALQVHLSGGEPMARPALDQIVAAARDAGLYSNLITSAVLLTEERMERLARAGLDHVQISFQDSEPARADRIAGYRGALAKKKRAAEAVRMCGLPLTVNLVV